MPIGGEHANGFLEGGLAAEVLGAVGRDGGVGFLGPVHVVAAVVGAVELVVRVDPAAEDHEFVFGEHLGVVVLGVGRVFGVGEDGGEDALGGAEAAGRQGRRRCSCLDRLG